MRRIPNEEFDGLPENLYDEYEESDTTSDEILALMEAGLSYEEAHALVENADRFEDEWDEWPGS